MFFPEKLHKNYAPKVTNAIKATTENKQKVEKFYQTTQTQGVLNLVLVEENHLAMSNIMPKNNIQQS